MILNELKQQISEVINNAHLSIDAVYFVMKDIFGEVEKLYFSELQREIEMKSKQVEKSENEEEPKE